VEYRAEVLSLASEGSTAEEERGTQNYRGVPFLCTERCGGVPGRVPVDGVGG
jgi:hypothetical protein